MSEPIPRWRDALEQLRCAVRELDPYLLDHLDLPSALETIAEQYAARGGYHVQIAIEPSAIGLHDQLVVSLVRELLANVTKHAAASHAPVELSYREHVLTLHVADDGRGFTIEQQLATLRAGHIGPASIRERGEASGGKREVFGSSGAGARVLCKVRFVPPRRPSAVSGINNNPVGAATGQHARRSIG